MMSNATRVLLKHRHTHGDMEPVENVFRLRGDQLRQRADFLATIGQKGNILIGLQALAFEHVEQPALRLAIVAMYQTDVPRLTVFGHRLADYDFEVGQSVPED